MKQTVIVLLGIVALIIAAISAHPLEENVADNKESPEKVNPILAADKIQKKTTEAQDANNEDDFKEHSSDSPASTEVYIEESYIAVLLPGIPALNTTELEAILNKTANTTNDDGVRSKRNPGNREFGQVENVSPPTSGSTVPSVLYSLRNSNDSAEAESSQKESKVSNNSSAAPPLYQLRSLNTRSSVDKDDRSSPKKIHDSSSSEESFEVKSDSSDERTVASPNAPNKRSKRSLDHSSGEREKSSLNKNLPKSNPSNSQAVNTRSNEEPNKDSSQAKVQQPTSTHATHPLYSAQNFYSRPERQASGNDEINRSSGGTSSNNKDQRGALPNDHLTSSSRSNVSPVYSAQYANVRHAREVVDSSEEESSTTSILEPASTSLARQ